MSVQYGEKVTLLHNSTHYRVHREAKMAQQKAGMVFIPAELMKSVLDIVAESLMISWMTDMVCGQNELYIIKLKHVMVRMYGLMDLPRVQTSVGQRSFAFHGPTVWNSLPSALRDSSLSLNTFKKRLKTYLFGQS